MNGFTLAFGISRRDLIDAIEKALEQLILPYPLGLAAGARAGG